MVFKNRSIFFLFSSLFIGGSSHNIFGTEHSSPGNTFAQVASKALATIEEEVSSAYLESLKEDKLKNKVNFEKSVRKIQTIWRERKGVFNEALQKGAILQSPEDGTAFSCAMLSIQSAYAACYGLEAQSKDQAEVNAVLKKQDPHFPTLKDLLYYYNNKIVQHNKRDRDLEYIYSVNNIGKEHIGFSTAKIGNQSRAAGLRRFKLKIFAIPVRKIEKAELIRLIKKPFQTKGALLLIHCKNHYTSIGGYRVTREGKFQIQYSRWNQLPDEWHDLDDVIDRFNRHNYFRMILATKKVKKKRLGSSYFL